MRYFRVVEDGNRMMRWIGKGEKRADTYIAMLPHRNFHSKLSGSTQQTPFPKGLFCYIIFRRTNHINR
jgi:hypothetical protein